MSSEEDYYYNKCNRHEAQAQQAQAQQAQAQAQQAQHWKKQVRLSLKRNNIHEK